MRSRLIEAITLALLATLAACSSTRLPGERYYLTGPGVGTAYLPRTVAAVHAAAVAALQQDLGYTIKSQTLEGDHGEVEAVTATGVYVTVETWPAAEGETRMVIGMGLDTPDVVVREVMSKIEARLLG